MISLKAISIARVGRGDFVLRTLVITATALAVSVLMGEALDLDELPHHLETLLQVALFCLIGRFWARTIDGRLLDAGLPSWLRYPTFAFWLASLVLPSVIPEVSLAAIPIFLVPLIAGGVYPGKVARGGPLTPREAKQSGDDDLARPRVRKSLPLVSRLGFLRTLVTLACVWLPLIWAESVSGAHLGAWLARFGYGILFVIWVVKVIGRLDDAGKPLHVKHGIFLTLLILCIAGLRHLAGGEWLLGHQNHLIDTFTHVLPRFLNKVNGYEKFGAFLLLQSPLILMPSRAERGVREFANDNYNQEDSDSRINVFALCGPFEFLRILLVIAALYIAVVYMDNTSNNGPGSWIARLVFCILTFFWLTFTHGRLRDAGWAHNDYPAQYFLVVTVVSLMPFALHVVNGYGAVAIFFIIQLPTVFMKSTSSTEGDE